MHFLIPVLSVLNQHGYARAMLIVLGIVSMSPVPAQAAHSGKSSPPYLGGIWIKPWDETDKLPPGVTKAELFPPDISMPDYTPEYQAKHEKIKAIQLSAGSDKGAGADAINTVAVQRQAKCLPYGMPRMMNWQLSLDILQAPDRITIAGEIDRELRRIWLNREQPPLDEVDLGWFGHSVGKWERNTLVVNTIGVKEEVDGENYMAHSDQMVIVERIYLHKPDVLYDDITITDPLALKKPLSYRSVWIRAPQDFEPVEYVCDNLRSYVNQDGKVVHDFDNKQ